MGNSFIRVDDYDFFSQVVKYAKSSLVGASAWRVDSHDADYYRSVNAECYVTKRGSTLAIAEDGTILSLCRHRDDRLNFLGTDMVEFAQNHGARKLDCYEGLSKLYEECGFEVVNRIAWDIKIAPKDWRPEYGEEDIVSLEYYDDFADLDLEREQMIKLMKCQTVEQCEDAVCEILNEFINENDDREMQIRCLDMVYKILEKKGVPLESIGISKDIYDAVVKNKRDIINDEFTQDFA